MAEKVGALVAQKSVENGDEHPVLHLPLMHMMHDTSPKFAAPSALLWKSRTHLASFVTLARNAAILRAIRRAQRCGLLDAAVSAATFFAAALPVAAFSAAALASKAAFTSGWDLSNPSRAVPHASTNSFAPGAPDSPAVVAASSATRSFSRWPSSAWLLILEDVLPYGTCAPDK